MPSRRVLTRKLSWGDLARGYLLGVPPEPTSSAPPVPAYPKAPPGAQGRKSHHIQVQRLLCSGTTAGRTGGKCS